MLIREARIEDTPYLPSIDLSAAQLFKTIPALAWIAKADPMPIEKHQLFLKQGKIWVAEIANQVVGFVIVKAHDLQLHIYELSVALSHQRRGVAKSLLATVFQYALQNKFTNISLTTFKEVPWNAPFYAKLGFKIISMEQQPDWLVTILAREERFFKNNQRCVMSKIID